MSGFFAKIKADAGISSDTPKTLIESAPDERIRFTPVTPPPPPENTYAKDLIETRGRKRIYATNADRQRAYRERRDANKEQDA